MFGIGMPEMILILGLALIVVGPDKLPELARSLAKGLIELKNTAQTLKDNIVSESPVLKEIQPELEDAARSIKGHIIDSIEDEGKTEKSTEEILGGIYNPLDDDDYDDEGEDYTLKGINPRQSDGQAEVTETTRKDDTGTDENAEPDPDPEKKYTIHSTVKQDLNKDPGQQPITASEPEQAQS